MARIDASLSLVPIGGNLSFVGAAGASFASTVLDLLGQGVGTAPQNIIGNASVFGTDFGIGAIKEQLLVSVGTAAATADACTLNCQFQGAEDTGSAGSYLPGAWQTFVETGPITAAQLTAAQIIARFDWPPAFPANFQPRYMRLNFTTPAGLLFTAGTIAFALVTDVRDDYAIKYASANYVVH